MNIFRSIVGDAVGKVARDRVAGRGFIPVVVGALATRMAMRSVPGALLVGGAIVAKHLWDRKRQDDPAVTTLKDKFAQRPDIAADIARTEPELLTDAADDIERAEAVAKRTGTKPETTPAT